MVGAHCQGRAGFARSALRLVAMEFGRKIAEGSPAEIQNDRDVVAAYLGTDV